MDNNGNTGSDIEPTKPVLRYNCVPVLSSNGNNSSQLTPTHCTFMPVGAGISCSGSMIS